MLTQAPLPKDCTIGEPAGSATQDSIEYVERRKGRRSELKKKTNGINTLCELCDRKKRSASRSVSLTINSRSSFHIRFVDLNAIAHIQLSTLLEGLRTETEKPLQKSQMKFFFYFIFDEKEAKKFWRNLLPKTQAGLWLMCSFLSTLPFRMFSNCFRLIFSFYWQ